MKLYIVTLLFTISSQVFAYSVIDLGNLEIEGEVRRPMINLYNNIVDQKSRFQNFAGELSNQDHSLDTVSPVSEDGLSQLREFENEFSEVH